MNNFKYIPISLIFTVIFSLQGCGGEEEPSRPPEDDKANAKEDTTIAPKKETPPELEEEPEPEPVQTEFDFGEYDIKHRKPN